MDALDNNILVWGIRQAPARDNLPERCKQLIKGLRDQRQPIMIPSIVLAEFLSFGDADSVQMYSTHLEKNFFIAPFDTKAAMLAAELQRECFGALKSDENISRQALKADIKIVATAIAHGAKAIYSDDSHFQRISNGRILVKQVPPLKGGQRDLFEQ